MRKLLLTTVMTIMAYPALAEVSCTVRPKCRPLGYVSTAEDCKGIPSIKCPFDDTLMFCGKEDPAAPPPAETETICAPGMFFYVQDSKCYEGYDLDKRYNEEMYVLSTRKDTCFLVPFSAQPASVVEKGDPTAARADAIQACKSGASGDLLSNAEMSLYLEKAGTWAFEQAGSINGFMSGNLVTKDGCYSLNTMAPTDCNASEDFAYLCKESFSCNAAGTSVPSVPCIVGTYYNSINKACATGINSMDTQSDHFILSTSSSGPCVVVGAGFSFGTRMDNSSGDAHIDVKPKAEQGCHDQYGDSYELPTMDEIEYMVKSNVTGPFEGANFSSGVVVASDGCINISTYARNNCNQDDDLAYVCKHRVNNCGAKTTTTIPVTTTVPCAQGAYYDAKTKTCGKTASDLMVVGGTATAPKVVNLQNGPLAKDPSNYQKATTLSVAQSAASSACVDGEGTALLTTSELKYLYDSKNTWPFELMNTVSGVVIGSDKCFDLYKGQAVTCPSTAADYGYLCYHAL